MTKPDPANSPTQWRTKGLLNKIEQLHQNNHDRAFAFILGAGASVNSNIPAAAALAKKWLQHIYEREVSESQADSLPIEAWAADRLGISLRFSPFSECSDCHRRQLHLISHQMHLRYRQCVLL